MIMNGAVHADTQADRKSAEESDDPERKHDRRSVRSFRGVPTQERDGQAGEDHHANVRRQPARDTDNQRPRVLFTPPIAPPRGGSRRSMRDPIIVAHGRESTPQPTD